MQITDALAAEHGVLYALFEHLEAELATASLEQVQIQGKMLEAAIASHAHLEDELLFATLEPYLGAAAGPLAVMRSEHATIEDGLARLAGPVEVGVARRLLREVIATAREHFAKEERVLFPMAQATLEPRVLAAQGSRWSERRHVTTAGLESPLVGTID